MLAMVFVATTSMALDLNNSKQTVRVPPASHSVVVDSSATLMGLATAYTVYSVDATDPFYVTRYFDGAVEAGLGIKVPAGQSLLIPAPQPFIGSGCTFYRHMMLFTGNADTTIVIPWVR
jgi:hypothetical protein